MKRIAFNVRLKKLRQEKDLTQKKLAEKLNVPPNKISAWENGRYQCCFDMLITLSSLFGVSVDYLLGFSKKKKRRHKKPN